MDEFEKELKKDFLNELEENLHLLEQSLLILEKNHEDSQSIEFIFRIFLNLKGSSSAVGYEKISRVTHELETFLDELIKNPLLLNEEGIKVLLLATDHLKNISVELKADLNAENIDENLLKSIQNLLQIETPEE